MKSDKPRLLVILGPTASGKSKLGMDIAEALRSEIVSADSLQLYRHLDIGTAKPSREERGIVPHRIIDIIDPDEEFNAGKFRAEARKVIAELHRSAKGIILVGGTYLYVKVLLSGLIEDLPADPEIRNSLKKLRSEFGTAYVYERLKSLDPAAAARIHPNDYVRAERALEVFYLTGEKMSHLQSLHEFGGKEFEYIKIGIRVDREELKRRIDLRVDKMIDRGLVDEVRGLRLMGYGPELKPMQSIGYKEINRHLDGEIGLDEAVGLIKRDTRRFAKRQMTWLRRDKEIVWFELPVDYEKVLDTARAFFGG
ncbi:MAG: tRNA (adenosine(37)-N6)-dimethylallyltransferase MiaA [Candidatus Dadabacteria bacterium]|nr:tRNA (adenosine(37)-N6)-dimethylallyltransferase MiaA [Candidatus Dadabacteria bacterium]